MKNNTIEVIGIDKGTPDGDQTALTIRVGDQMHIVPDPFASVLVRHIEEGHKQSYDAGYEEGYQVMRAAANGEIR